MRETLQRNWFLVALIVALLVGMFAATTLEPLVDALPRDWIIGIVLLAMALPLKLDAVWDTLRHPGPALLAVTMNLLAVPMLALAASPLLIEDLAIGLLIVSVVPCTLASAAVWTRLAGGNAAVSLLVTVITNLSCFAVTPVWLKLLIGEGGGTIDFGSIATRLFVLVVAPILLAQLLRLHPLVAQAAASRGKALSTFAMLGVLTMIFAGSVHCGLRLRQLEGAAAGVAGQIVLMLLLVAVVHLAAWWLGFYSAAQLGMRRPEQLAVAFSGSQKTIMVGIAVALEFSGLTILPILAYHVIQLLIDTVLANRCRETTDANP